MRYVLTLPRLTLWLMTMLFCTLGTAQQQQPDTTAQEDAIPGEAVVLRGDTLFYLYGDLGAFSSSDRAAALSSRLERMTATEGFSTDSIGYEFIEDGVRFNYAGDPFFVLNDIDIRGSGLANRNTAATTYLQIFQDGLAKYNGPRGMVKFVREILLVAATIFVIWLLIWLVNRAFRVVRIKVQRESDKWVRRLRLHDYNVLSAERQLSIINFGMNMLRWVMILLILYLALPVVFSFIPGMEGVANRLLGYITTPLRNGFNAFVAYIPELISIAIIVFVTRALVRGMRTISKEIATGKLHVQGFYADWAMPTYNILKFIVYIFAFVLIFPLLPGSDSGVFQGVSVFVGLLISLGSQSAISNMIAGLVITYMRAFSVGDRVKIGQTVGDVLERSMLVTRVRTIKNEVVTIPNSSILTGQTINYSSDQKVNGLILYTSVTIGYDVPWRKVHELLLEAAAKTPRVKNEPAPFVLQTGLDDFYIRYELNAYTDSEYQAALIYSDLHANIQDVFNTAKVEIMSPHYRVNRQTLDSTIPNDDLSGGGGEADSGKNAAV